MLTNQTNIEEFEKQINRFRLSEKMNQSGYKDLFYEHLTGLSKFRMLSKNNDIDELVLNKKNYLGLEQFVFEHPTFVEDNISTNQIDWDFIDEAKYNLERVIISSLGIKGSYSQSNLKPIVKFSVNNFENFLIYNYMYPDSISNPWLPTKMITMDNGYLFLLSDEKEQVREFNKKIVDKSDEDSSDLFLLVKNKSDKKFGGFSVDTRSNIQGLVFEYLKKEACGIRNAVKTEAIASFLKNQQRAYTQQEVRVKVLLPLKRAGLIGSTTNGYFYINSPDDLRSAYRHHEEKLQGLQRTLNMYKAKAKSMKIDL